MFSTSFYGRVISGIFVKHTVIWSIRNLDTEIKPNKFYFYKNLRPSDMREEISKLPSSIQSFANVFQLLLNFVMMVIILNFIISIICDVEKEVRIGNKSKDWLNYLYSKGRFDIFNTAVNHFLLGATKKMCTFFGILKFFEIFSLFEFLLIL